MTPGPRRVNRNLRIVDPFPVRCIDARWPFEAPIGLTKGKCYMVVATKESTLQMRNDFGEVVFYDSRRFESVPQCRKCGGFIRLEFNEHLNRKLMKLHMCHECEFWAVFKHNMHKEPHRHFVMYGLGYSAEPDGSRGIDGCKGFGGVRWYIRFADGYCITTDNMYGRGDIPIAWKQDLPDNATEITGLEYDEWLSRHRG